jgi:hypothetical protein
VDVPLLFRGWASPCISIKTEASKVDNSCQKGLRFSSSSKRSFSSGKRAVERGQIHQTRKRKRGNASSDRYLGVYHRHDALPNGQPTLMQTPESGLLQLDMVEDITRKLFRPSSQSDNPPILLPIFQKSCSV